MEFTIRKATPDDAEAACAVLRRSIQECCVDDHRCDPAILDAWLRNKTPEIVRSWFRSPKTYSVIAETRAGIVGVGMLEDESMITLCYLVPEARYLGIGRAMLAAMETEARARGLAAVDLCSTKAGYAFYKRSGYVDTGKISSIFGLSAPCMRKDLRQV